MEESELKIINGNKNLIICFGGCALQFGGILPFEFLNYLSKNYKNDCDLIFFIDKKQCYYHQGISNITNNIEETTEYLNIIINNYSYKNVIFMGTSAGGYASILFGSLCKNVNYVISFIPQTIILNTINPNYSNLKTIINSNTNYVLFGDTNIVDINNNHHILHCENLKNFPNIKINEINGIDMKILRDTGIIKNTLDEILKTEI